MHTAHTHTHSQILLTPTKWHFPTCPEGMVPSLVTNISMHEKRKWDKKIMSAQDQERQRGVGYGDITHDGSCTGGVTSFTLHK